MNNLISMKRRNFFRKASLGLATAIIAPSVLDQTSKVVTDANGTVFVDCVGYLDSGIDVDGALWKSFLKVPIHPRIYDTSKLIDNKNFSLCEDN